MPLAWIYFRPAQQRLTSLLLDLTLPGMSGGEVLEGLRKIRPRYQGCCVNGVRPRKSPRSCE